MLSTGPTLPFAKPRNLYEGIYNLFEILTSSLKPVIVFPKKLILPTILFSFSIDGYSQEMPTGGNVQSGTATISGYGTNELRIDQKSQKSIIHWDSFSINPKGRVDFNQPSSSSFSLNRVNGSTPSSIAGKLNSNGKVMLINPNGIAITPGAVINTNSFTASSLDIKNEDFLKDKYIFEGKGNSKGGNVVAFGDFGIQAVETSYVTARQIEAARITITRTMKRGGKVWINIFPHKPITKKPAEVRMGSGKGNVEYYVAVVKPGRILFEISGVPEDVAREAMRKACLLYTSPSPRDS